MVRRDRNKINNLRDDLKKFKENLWELENSDGFQFCSKYAEKCSKGNKFGFQIFFFCLHRFSERFQRKNNVIDAILFMKTL